MNSVKYLNNERKLYDYIKKHKDRQNLLVTTDDVLSKEFDTNKITILRWRKRLIDLNLINYSSKWVCGKKQGVYEIKK